MKSIGTDLENLDTGAVVYIDPMYDWTEKKDGKKFFVSVLSGDCVLLADTKKQAVNERRGHIYLSSQIVKC